MKGKMEIAEELVKFVQKKRSILKDQFTLPDFLEFLLPEMRSLYTSRLEDEMEEFECRFAMSGEDQIFFNKYFAPTAMLKIYLKSHPSATIDECILELFTISRNSRTKGSL